MYRDIHVNSWRRILAWYYNKVEIVENSFFCLYLNMVHMFWNTHLKSIRAGYLKEQIKNGWIQIKNWSQTKRIYPGMFVHITILTSQQHEIT